MKKKILSLVLTALLLFSLVPTFVFAAGEGEGSGVEPLVFLPRDLVDSNTTNAALTLVDEEGNTYLNFDPTNSNNGTAAINLSLSESVAKDAYNFAKVGIKTNVTSVTGRTTSFTVTDSAFSVKYVEAKKNNYWPETISGITEDDIVFDLSTKKSAAESVTEFQYYRFLPFAGQAAEPEGTAFVFYIEYIALFNSEPEAEGFDFDEYLVSLNEVTFQNRLGEEISSKIYRAGEAVEFPEAPELSGYTFLGWSADEGETFVEAEGYVAAADITLKAIYTEATSEEDTEFLGTFITILKMITAKKAVAEDTTYEGIVYTAGEIAARSVTSGEDFHTNGTVKRNLAGGKTVFESLGNKVRYTNSNVGAASTANDRAIVDIDDINLTEYPYIAIKYNTNIAADIINFNFTTINGTYTKETEQKLFLKIPRTLGEDTTGIAQYTGSYGDATATYMYIPIYSSTKAVSAEGDYFDIIALGFFKTEKDANAFAAAKVDNFVYDAKYIANNAVTSGEDFHTNGTVKRALSGGKTVFEALSDRVRFTNSNVGAASTTSDRAIVKVDDINLTEYPYIAIKYNTNIAAEQINFNFTTINGTYTKETEQKLFLKLDRIVGEDAVGIAQYTGNYGDVVVIYMYIPIYSSTKAVSAEGDYFDIIALGFFKTEEEANAFAGIEEAPAN